MYLAVTYKNKHETYVYDDITSFSIFGVFNPAIEFLHKGDLIRVLLDDDIEVICGSLFDIPFDARLKVVAYKSRILYNLARMFINSDEIEFTDRRGWKQYCLLYELEKCAVFED